MSKIHGNHSYNSHMSQNFYVVSAVHSNFARKRASKRDAFKSYTKDNLIFENFLSLENAASHYFDML